MFGKQAFTFVFCIAGSYLTFPSDARGDFTIPGNKFWVYPVCSNDKQADTNLSGINNTDQWGNCTSQTQLVGPEASTLTKCFLSKMSCYTIPSCTPACYIKWDESGSTNRNLWGTWHSKYAVVDVNGVALHDADATVINTHCSNCLNNRVQFEQNGLNPECTECDEKFKAKCFSANTGCDKQQYFNNMQQLLVKLAEKMLPHGISLYLDFEDGPAEEYLESRRAETQWSPKTVGMINMILKNRVELAENHVFMPSSTGEFCVAELAASRHSGKRQHTVIPPIIFSEITQWMQWMQPVSNVNKNLTDELVTLLTSVCKGSATAEI